MGGTFTTYRFYAMLLSAVFVSLFLVFGFVHAAQQANIDITVQSSVCGNTVKEGGEQCDNSALGGMTCSDLGFDGGSLACSSSCEFETSGCTTDATAHSTVLLSGQSGGDYTLVDGVSSVKIQLPASFYGEDVRLELFSCNCSVDVPQDMPQHLVGNIFTFTFLNEDGTVLDALNAAATIIITYDDGDVATIDEGTLVPYRRPAGTASWTPVSDVIRDVENNTVTFTVSQFSSFALFGEEPAGQSGGGTFINTTPSAVAFSGFAAPGASVTLLKDGYAVVSTDVEPTGAFSLPRMDVSPGTFQFGFVTVAPDGSRTAPHSFRLSIAANTTTFASGIVLPPTLAVTENDDAVRLQGYTVPGALVLTSVDRGPYVPAVTAGPDGRYVHEISTVGLSRGVHTIHAVAQAGSEEFRSGISDVQSFGVGVPAPPVALGADLDGDGRVNLVDFSILLSLWGRQPLENGRGDFDQDGMVTLRDFAILAFQWTG